MPQNLAVNKQTQKQRLLSSSFRFLKTRSRSKQEIRDYLSRKSKDLQVIESVIRQLEDLNLIDDQKFAAWLTESRLRHKPKGPIAIKLELKKFGVDPQIIDQTLSQIPQESWNQAARNFLTKKQRIISKQPPKTRPYKAKQLLYSRGFNPTDFLEIIDEMLS